MAAEDIDLTTIANAPKRGKTDGVEFEGHPLKDIKAVRDEEAANTALAHKNRGLILTRLNAPGTVGPSTT